MRTKTVNIPLDTHRALKQVALDRDTSISGLIAEMVPLVVADNRRNLTAAMQEAGCNHGNCPTCASVSLGMLAILFPQEYAEEMRRLGETHP